MCCVLFSAQANSSFYTVVDCNWMWNLLAILRRLVCQQSVLYILERDVILWYLHKPTAARHLPIGMYQTYIAASRQATQIGCHLSDHTRLKSVRRCNAQFVLSAVGIRRRSGAAWQCMSETRERMSSKTIVLDWGKATQLVKSQP